MEILRHVFVTVFSVLLYFHPSKSQQAKNMRPDPQLVAVTQPRTTSFGQVRGGTMRTRNGNTAEAFLGLPFAKPPLGPLRFREPQTTIPYNQLDGGQNVYDATRYRDDCLGLAFNGKLDNGFPQSEDCLYLSIYKPQNAPAAGARPHPVMVGTVSVFVLNSVCLMYPPSFDNE